MQIIYASTLSPGFLIELFRSRGLQAEHVQVVPGGETRAQPPQPGVSVRCPNGTVVSVFLVGVQPQYLRLRSVVASRAETDSIDAMVLLDWQADANMKLSALGATSVHGPYVTLEYSLPLQQAILDCTILNAVTELAQGSARGRQEFELLKGEFA